MIYRTLGKTGLEVSVLGFGCLRLPELPAGSGRQGADDARAVPLLRRAFELGVNYFDTGWGYMNEDSQRVLGQAVAPFRDRVILTNKMPLYLVKKPDDFWYFLERELELMQTDHLDILMFHQLGERFWNQTVVPLGLVRLAEQAKARNLIRHIGFSFHDRPDYMKVLVDTGVFEAVLCQYNLIDQTNADAMAYAREKGLGVLTMGSAGAGNISVGGDAFRAKFPLTPARTATELALRFVWGNPNVDVALSGMENLAMLEENAAAAARADEIPPKEAEQVGAAARNLIGGSRMADFYCTACRYCDVCPRGVRPFMTIRPYNYWKIWGMEDTALADYRALGSDVWTGAKPEDCISCGKCRSYCPQGIDIPAVLAEADAAFKKLTADRGKQA